MGYVRLDESTAGREGVTLEFKELIEVVNEIFGKLVQDYGSLGIAAAMFAESAGVPFASAVVIITSGPMIFSGKVSFWSVLAASTAGIILGSLLSYSLGFMSSIAGRYIKKSLINGPDLPEEKGKRRSRIVRLWERYGIFSVFMAQLWGVTRTFISFPAGVMKMNILLFISYTALGGVLFSLGAIGFSIALTGAMSMVVSITRFLLGLSPWVWVGALLVLVTAIILYRKYRLRLSPLHILRRGKTLLTIRRK